MTKLPAGKRKQLPDNAFAYIDAQGRRRLPIYDEAHVRNALSRFNQVIFDDEASSDKARTRLLKAARKYGIVPIGFIDGQIRARGPRSLPSGRVTFLMTDIVESTGLLQRLGDGYATLLTDYRRLIRSVVRRNGGREVDARADEFFAAFKPGSSAIVAALGIRRAVAGHGWPDDAAVQVRIGVHAGRPTLTETGYVGLAVHAVNRICGLADAGQIVMSGATLTPVARGRLAEATFAPMGQRRLRGVRGSVLLFTVGEQA
jgi:class 3 adenylate cyclase